MCVQCSMTAGCETCYSSTATPSVFCAAVGSVAGGACHWHSAAIVVGRLADSSLPAGTCWAANSSPCEQLEKDTCLASSSCSWCTSGAVGDSCFAQVRGWCCAWLLQEPQARAQHLCVCRATRPSCRQACSAARLGTLPPSANHEGHSDARRESLGGRASAGPQAGEARQGGFNCLGRQQRQSL